MKPSNRVIAAFVMLAGTAALLSGQMKIPSPDGKLYALEEAAKNSGRGLERTRFAVFTSGGSRISVLHIWLTQPDGAARVGIRGCESSGWVTNRTFFCEGSINPSTGVYLWFDAGTGKELGEALGTQFTWSPDRTRLARFGNVPHFTEADSKSDSLEIGDLTWPPESGRDGEQHWFRSALSWSPDSRFVAVVDHQRRTRKAFFLEIVDAKTGSRIEHQLQWPDEIDEWYPAHDFTVAWSTGEVTVHRAAVVQSFSR